LFYDNNSTRYLHILLKAKGNMISFRLRLCRLLIAYISF